MKLSDAKKLAVSLIKGHGLTEWSFEFDRAVRRFGCCHFKDKKITLSSKLVELNSEEQVTDTILHEIAHALVGRGHGHNRVWRRQALSIGCSGARCYSNEVAQPTLKYTLTCPNCGRETKRAALRNNLACGECCRRYNGGKYTVQYKFNVTIN